MRKQDLAEKLARETRRSKAAAADEIDRVVNHILLKLRRGEAAHLPGLGTFVPGPQPAFEFEPHECGRGRK